MGALADSWSSAARGYDVYWGPRFAPWAADVRQRLVERATALPAGPVLVPTCGPGRELVPLSAALPERHVVGVDLSPGMIALARIRCAGSPWLHAEVADASALAGAFGPAAAIASVFGFQQLPQPDIALADWCATLAPGGVAVICYWPGARTDPGPYTLAREVMARHAPATRSYDWEPRLTGVATSAGCEVELDTAPRHPVEYSDAAEFWDALLESGSGRALADRVGPGVTAAMRADFLAAHPPGPITHHPAARLLVIRRPA